MLSDETVRLWAIAVVVYSIRGWPSDENELTRDVGSRGESGGERESLSSSEMTEPSECRPDERLDAVGSIVVDDNYIGKQRVRRSKTSVE